MKQNLKFIGFGWIVAGALAVLPASAASLMIDTFDEGTFSLSTDQSSGVTANRTGNMIGGSRMVNISTSRRQTVVTSQLEIGTSVLTFDTGDGPSSGGSLGEGYVRMYWQTGGGTDMAGFTGFLLRIASLEGSGEVHVGLNSRSWGTSSTRVPIPQSGDLFIPFDQVDIQSGTLRSIRSIQLIVSGTSPDFALSIDSFEAVPEPSAAALTLGAFAAGLARRRRERPLP